MMYAHNIACTVRVESDEAVTKHNPSEIFYSANSDLAWIVSQDM